MWIRLTNFNKKKLFVNKIFKRDQIVNWHWIL